MGSISATIITTFELVTKYALDLYVVCTPNLELRKFLVSLPRVRSYIRRNPSKFVDLNQQNKRVQKQNSRTAHTICFRYIWRKEMGRKSETRARSSTAAPRTTSPWATNLNTVIPEEQNLENVFVVPSEYALFHADVVVSV